MKSAKPLENLFQCNSQFKKLNLAAGSAHLVISAALKACSKFSVEVPFRPFAELCFEFIFIAISDLTLNIISIC